MFRRHAFDTKIAFINDRPSSNGIKGMTFLSVFICNFQCSFRFFVGSNEKHNIMLLLIRKEQRTLNQNILCLIFNHVDIYVFSYCKQNGYIITYMISNNLLVNSMLKYFETVNLTFTWCSIVWQLTLTIISKHFVMPSIMSLESHQNCFVHD